MVLLSGSGDYHIPWSATLPPSSNQWQIDSFPHHIIPNSSSASLFIFKNTEPNRITWDNLPTPMFLA